MFFYPEIWHKSLKSFKSCENTHFGIFKNRPCLHKLAVYLLDRSNGE